jgi:hypothetical protein
MEPFGSKCRNVPTTTHLGDFVSRPTLREPRTDTRPGQTGNRTGLLLECHNDRTTPKARTTTDPALDFRPVAVKSLTEPTEM